MSHVLPKKHLKRPLQTDFRAKCSKTELEPSPWICRFAYTSYKVLPTVHVKGIGRVFMRWVALLMHFP